MQRTLVLAALVAVAGACGDDDDVTSDGAIGADAVVDAAPHVDAQEVACTLTGSAVPLADLSGVYAYREVLATIAVAPIVGVVDDRAVTIGMATFSAEGEAITMTVRACSLTLETDNPSITTEMLPGYPPLLAQVPLAASLDEDGMLSAIGPVEQEGVVLADPENDELPTEPDDPRVVDSDGDGHPGFTVIATVTGAAQASMYMIERIRHDLTCGQLDTAGRIRGGMVIHKFDQEVLDATSLLFASTPEVAANDEGSSFTLVRMDGTVSCDTILAADEATLFGAR